MQKHGSCSAQSAHTSLTSKQNFLWSSITGRIRFIPTVSYVLNDLAVCTHNSSGRRTDAQRIILAKNTVFHVSFPDLSDSTLGSMNTGGLSCSDWLSYQRLSFTWRVKLLWLERKWPRYSAVGTSLSLACNSVSLYWEMWLHSFFSVPSSPDSWGGARERFSPGRRGLPGRSADHG